MTITECCFFNPLLGEALTALLCDSEPVEFMASCPRDPLSSTCDRLADERHRLQTYRGPCSSRKLLALMVCWGGGAGARCPCCVWLPHKWVTASAPRQQPGPRQSKTARRKYARHERPQERKIFNLLARKMGIWNRKRVLRWTCGNGTKILFRYIFSI